MEVHDKIFYHFHKPYIKSDSWFIGNEIIIDDNYNSEFISSCAESYKKCILMLDEIKKNPDRIIKLWERGISTSDLKNVIQVYKREQVLEKCRMEYHKDLPSRYHSLWLCDELQIGYWIYNLEDNCELYKMLVNGNIFISNDEFLPDDKCSGKKLYEKSKRYWNPDRNRDTSKDEILFQGRIKILEKLDIEKYRKKAMEEFFINTFGYITGAQIIKDKKDYNNFVLKLK